MKNRLPTFLALAIVCAFAPSLFAQTYNIYYGDIHSHSWYSDGNQDQNPSTYTVPVARSLTYARDVANDMDFLGISDHNHNESLNMTMAYWLAGNHEADSINQDGVFVGMRGQEWGTISGGGHVLIYGTDRLFGWNPGVYQVYVPKSNYTLLFDSVAKYGGFAYLAHPQSDDYSGIFTNAYNAKWDSVVQGVALRNGPATSTNTSETDPSGTSYEGRYHDLLRLGYHVAPCANQDNHNTTFGRVNQQRTAVLATSLTRANVVDALRNRRAYATTDHNLQLRFEVGSHQMGEIFNQSSPIQFRVKVTDPDGVVSQIQLRYGVPGSGSAPTTLTSVNNVDSLVFSQAQAIGTTFYYYAYVIETSGRMAHTAPMWITVPTGPVPEAFTLSLPANSSANQAVGGTLTWQASVNATQYDVYLGPTNPPTTIVSADQAGTSYVYGGLANNTQYWWKVVAKNVNGSVVASGAPWNFGTIVASPSAFAQASPSNLATKQPLNGSLTWQSSANASQYDLYFDTNAVPVTLVSSQAGTTYNYSGLAYDRNYYWKVVASNIAGTQDALGAPWSFGTVGPPPGPFALASPPQNAVAQPLSGSFQWNSASGADAYDIYVDVVNPPSVKMDSNLTATTYAYAGLLAGHTYYWKIVARNVDGATVCSDTARSFSTVSAPAAVSNLSTSNITTTGARLTWTDNASDETGYHVYRSLAAGGPFVLLGGDLPPNTTTFDDSGLAVNERYFYRISPFNDVGEASFASVNLATSALVPGVPTISGVGYLSLTLTMDPSANPPETEFAIRVKRNANPDGYVRADGSVGGAPAWQTFAQWGGAGGGQVHGLHSCDTYSFSVIARNLDNEETPAGSEAGQTLPCFTVTQNVVAGWNLLSLPVVAPDPAITNLFPGGVSGAFVYSGSYQRKDTIPPGTGFWLKYGSGAPIEFSGEPRTNDTIPVAAGWNLVGSLSQPVAASAIVVEPPSILASRFFGFNGSYVAADSLVAMRGYWVKASAPGVLILSSSHAVPSAAQKPGVPIEVGDVRVTFEDEYRHRQTLTLRMGIPAGIGGDFLPPLPPDGAFDVRFENGHSSVAFDNARDIQRFPVVFQAVGKVTVTLDGVGSIDVRLDVEAGGLARQLSNHGSIALDEPSGKIFLVVRPAGHQSDIPTVTSLLQNYPNPFNPVTGIRYQLAEAGRVIVRIMNVLGQDVRVIVDEEKEAGAYVVSWDAGGLPSGVYFCRLDVVSVGSARFSQVRKLLYMK